MHVPRARVRIALAAAVAAVALLIPASPAQAGEVFRNAGSETLSFTAGVGETNDVTLSLVGASYRTHDASAPVNTTGAGGCTSVDPNTVDCPVAGTTSAFWLMGDQDDHATIDVSLPAEVIGEDGDDTLTGGSGPDQLRGEQGSDTLLGREGGDDLSEATSTDTASNTLDGGPGSDVLQGGPGGDTMHGGADNDYVSGLGGDDRVNGDDGGDILSGGDGTDTLDGGSGEDTLGSMSRLGITQISPERGNDTLNGGSGDDVLRTGFGPDGMIPDADKLNGGDGFDTVTNEGRDAPIRLSLDGAANDGLPGEGDAVASDVEKGVGGSSDDTLTGSPRADTLDGAGGSDAIDGGDGNDQLDGGATDAGDDVISGDGGNDRITGNGGNDEADGGSGSDTVDGGSDADNLRGGSGDDKLTGGAGADTVAGGAGNDTVDGSGAGVGGADGGDKLSGDSGNDVLTGGEGADRITGGTGSDRVVGGPGKDTAGYQERSRSSGRVSVSLDGRRNDGARGERDNVEADVENVAGGAVDDTFTGSKGGNRLDGADGEDYEDGGAGKDVLKGGTAGDVVRSRDGKVDSVDCGRGRGADFAIVDPGDRVKRCETVENGEHTRPALGQAVVVDPQRGSNQFGPTGIKRTVPLKDRLRIPVGSKVNARKGRVGLSSSTGHGRQSGEFSGGSFTVGQGRHSALTELRLRGGDFANCPRTRRGQATASSRRRIARKLRVRAHGRFRARGNYSAATVRGTVFTIADRCDGTLTVVKRGSVRVADFTRHRTVVVKAGERYLAPRR